jgi:hypothetical protein
MAYTSHTKLESTPPAEQQSTGGIRNKRAPSCDSSPVIQGQQLRSLMVDGSR